MTKDELIDQIESTAMHCRSINMFVKINHAMPWVDVYHGHNEYGDAIVYFFQGESADNLLAECPDYVSEEDYILWVSQGW